jgi:hypothetical protein
VQTGPGGHEDVRSNIYGPSTWKESATSCRLGKAKWHGKVGVVSDTQAFLKQLQSRQQASMQSLSCMYVFSCKLVKFTIPSSCDTEGGPTVSVPGSRTVLVCIQWPPMVLCVCGMLLQSV